MMRKTLILGILLVFALSVQVSSRNHPVISKSGTETFSVAPTQQEKPVIPKKDTSKAKTVKPPQLSDWEAAVNDVLNAAEAMKGPSLVFERAMETLEHSPTIQKDVFMKTYVSGMRQKGIFRIHVGRFITAARELKSVMEQGISAGRLK
jgi:hypothetical protein